MIKVHLETVHDVVIVKINGRIDAHSSKTLTENLEIVYEEYKSHHVIIDMKEVEYISSSGLGIIVSLKRSLELRNKEMKLCGITPAVKKVFKVLGMEKSFDIYASVNKALDSF